MKARCFLAGALLGIAALSSAQVNVTTYHNDNGRTGLNSSETTLTPKTVKPSTFGVLFSQKVDGQVYAQPLYLSNVAIPGKGAHNVVYVETEHNSVYAFDADNNLGANAQPLWHVNLGPSVPNWDTGTGDINTEIGITGTPVIAPAGTSQGATPTIYLVSKTKTFDENNQAVYENKLHALDATTGAEKFGGPVLIQGQVNGTGEGSDGNGHVVFNQLLGNQRAGLLLIPGNGGNSVRPGKFQTNGALPGARLYIAFASHGDNGPYHGWVFSFNPATLQQVGIWNTTPNALNDPSGYPIAAGGIWQGGAGLASDGASIYFATGNGTFNPSNGSYGDSIVRLGGDLTLGDYFAPADQQDLDNSDADLGSGGVVLLPQEAGSATIPNLAVAVGKEGSIYLMKTNGLGGNDTVNHVVKELNHVIGGVWGVPAYFHGNLYFGPIYGPIAQIAVSNADFPQNGVSFTSPDSYGYPGPTPSVSSNGNSNGVVWAIEADNYDSNGPSYLKAYDAANVSNELYDSSTTGGRDYMGTAVKFAVPTVANGKVYTGQNGQLTVFGLGTWAAAPQITPAGGNYINSVKVTVSDTTAGAQIYYTLDGSVPTTSSKLYTGPVTLTSSAYFTARAFVNGASGSAPATNTYVINYKLGNGTGLIGAYFNGTTDPTQGDSTVNQLDPTINFNWSGSSPANGVAGENWSVRWTGFIQAKSTATYTFYTNSDDGVRLTINGKQIINDWTYHGATVDTGTITLTGGKKYPITLDFFQGGGDSLLSLSWSAPGIPQEIVPTSQLFFTFHTGDKGK